MRPRFTGDLDILIRPTPKNAAKIVAVLNKFGFGNLGVSASDFTTSEQLIQLGRAPKRIDLPPTLVTHDNMGEPRIQQLLNPDLERYLK